MAGIWERIKPGGNDRISIHMIVAGLKGYATGVFTTVQVRDALNAKLATPLTAAEQTDLTNMAVQIDDLTNTTAKLVYGNNLEAIMIAAENGAVNETKFRADLGI